MPDNRLFESLQLAGFLSFAPDAPRFELMPLNVIIGPNGSGKSNLIEAFELLHAVSTDLPSVIREGGGSGEWIWKGVKQNAGLARIDAVVGMAPTNRPLRYRLAFAQVSQRLEIVDEAIEETKPSKPGADDVFFYYRLQNGIPFINVRGNGKGGSYTKRRLERADILPEQSVLAQRKDPDVYPELGWTAGAFERIMMFREWTFGRRTELRRPQQADDPVDELLPSLRNLGLVLNEIQHRGGKEIDALLRRFLPRYERLSVRIFGGTVQLYAFEDGLSEPIPATRLSDGTLRFLAILAALFAPTPPRLLCIEEPELGMHPDALGLLAELFVDASKRMQLLVTTHSDVLLSALTEKLDSVMVCENRGAGTTLQHLDSGRLSFWLKNYKLGEIWRLGEIGGNP